MDDKMIQEAVRWLLNAAPEGAKVILSGSHARGDDRHDSEVDFLVIEPVVKDHLSEISRLVDAICPLNFLERIIYRISRIYCLKGE